MTTQTPVTAEIDPGSSFSQIFYSGSGCAGKTQNPAEGDSCDSNRFIWI